MTAGTRRPGGRTARTRTAVLNALRAELVDSDWADITVEKIATRAGVAKTTVYRRWGSLDGLLIELLDDLAATQIPIPDTGTLEGDLRALARGIITFYDDPARRRMMSIVVAAAINDTDVRASLTAFFAVRNQTAAEIVRRAITRGEIPADTDPIEPIRTMGAPFYYRLFITGEPIDDSVADRAATTATQAARSGTLSIQPRTPG